MIPVENEVLGSQTPQKSFLQVVQRTKLTLRHLSANIPVDSSGVRIILQPLM